MALLVPRADGAAIPVPNNCMVGRDHHAWLRLDKNFVSSQHARIRYRGGAWTVSDLSRNGTWVNGTKVPPRTPRTIVEGDTIAFGNPDLGFTFTNMDPPLPMAKHRQTLEIRVAHNGILALPSEENARIVVFEDADGQWVGEVDGEPQPVQDGDIAAGADVWMLRLPLPSISTHEMAKMPLTISTAHLRLSVSRDEEQVAITALVGGQTLTLAPRVHYYLLLTLARERLSPEKAADKLPHEQGWIPVDTLCRMLAVDELNLNTQVFRIRGDFTSLGFVDGGTVIERRRGLRTLRLSTDRVSIVTSD
ncbi:MAG: FHA domain-containing protein [Polyangiaceae bacterium]|nr:FHA domain-containing protein [Polyangiaceae bacterium]